MGNTESLLKLLKSMRRINQLEINIAEASNTPHTFGAKGNTPSSRVSNMQKSLLKERKKFNKIIDAGDLIC